jgi:hypothetical protein
LSPDRPRSPIHASEQAAERANLGRSMGTDSARILDVSAPLAELPILIEHS